jgi:hypothetical protein
MFSWRTFEPGERKGKVGWTIERRNASWRGETDTSEMLEYVIYCAASVVMIPVDHGHIPDLDQLQHVRVVSVRTARPRSGLHRPVPVSCIACICFVNSTLGVQADQQVENSRMHSLLQFLPQHIDQPREKEVNARSCTSQYVRVRLGPERVSHDRCEKNSIRAI